MIARLVIGACIMAVALSACAAENPSENQAPLTGKVPRIAGALLALHEEHREHIRREGDDQRFKSVQPNVTVIENRVLIDATAVDDAEKLKKDLEELGCTGAVAAAKIVSCQLPIVAIPRLSSLESLAFARPVQAMTRRPQPVSH